MKSGFKRIINLNRYKSKLTEQTQNRYFDYLIDPSSQGVNKLIVLLFKNVTDREVHTGCFLPKVEIKNYNVMNDGTNFFDQLVKNDLQTLNNIQKITTSQGDDYTTGFLLYYLYFEEHYKLIVIDSSKQKKN